MSQKRFFSPLLCQLSYPASGFASRSRREAVRLGSHHALNLASATARRKRRMEGFCFASGLTDGSFFGRVPS
jgi:hypothetical protein